MPASPPDAAPGAPAVQVAARLLMEGRADEAVRWLEAFLEAAPAYATAHVVLAKAYEAAGRRADALEAWNRAAFLVPESPLVRRERARLLGTVPTAPPPPAARIPTPAPEAAPPPPAAPPEPTALPPPEPPTEAAPTPVAEGPTAAAERADPSPPALPGEAPVPEAAPATEGATTLAEEPLVMAPEAEGAPEPEAPPEEEEPAWRLLEETEVGVAFTPTQEEPPIISPADPGAAPYEGTPFVEDARIVEEQEGAPAFDDLDALIHQLQDAPRIRPDPHFEGPEVSFEEDEVADDMVSETLARIFAAQHQFVEAAIVYEKLAAQKPDQAEELLRKAEEMRAQGDA